MFQDHPSYDDNNNNHESLLKDYSQINPNQFLNYPAPPVDQDEFNYAQAANTQEGNFDYPEMPGEEEQNDPQLAKAPAHPKKPQSKGLKKVPTKRPVKKAKAVKAAQKVHKKAVKAGKVQKKAVKAVKKGHRKPAKSVKKAPKTVMGKVVDGSDKVLTVLGKGTVAVVKDVGKSVSALANFMSGNYLWS